MNSNIIDSIIDNKDEPKKTKVLDLCLDLVHPEIPTKYYAQIPMPRPKHVGCASLLAWLLFSNRFYLDSRWFNDNKNYWAKQSLMKLTSLTSFFRIMAFLRPTIQRSWVKIIWIIVRFIFVILTIIGVVGLAAFNSADTWTNNLIIGLLGTGLAFVSLNILFWCLSFALEKLLNKKWHPNSKNKSLIICVEEFVRRAKKRFNCDLLELNINVLILDKDSIIGKNVSKKTLKEYKQFEKEIASWQAALSCLIDYIEKHVHDIKIVTPIVKMSVSDSIRN